MNLLAYKSNTFMVWHLSPCYIFCITFKEKYFFRYILLTEQIPLFDCLYYQRRIQDCCNIQDGALWMIVSGWKPLTIITTKRSILDVAAALDPPLITLLRYYCNVGQHVYCNCFLTWLWVMTSKNLKITSFTHMT